MSRPVPGIDVESFAVMELLARARELAAAGRRVVHLEVGEPDYGPPPAVVRAVRAALAKGTRYTPTPGLPSLREALAVHYHPLPIDPNQILVAPGSSPLLWATFAALVPRGGRIGILDPGYPCYRNFATLVGAEPVPLPLDPATGFRPDPEGLLAAMAAAGPLDLLVLASPANPTGMTVPSDLLVRVAEQVPWVVVDESYRGLRYDLPAARAMESLLATELPNLIVVDSFSKRYGMTGLRLGWGVLPPGPFASVERILQNVVICANEPTQHGGVVALTDPEAGELLARRRTELAARRDLLVAELERIGLTVARPEGAFYLLADLSASGRDSFTLAREALEATGVAVAPGADFGSRTAGFVRLSFTRPREELVSAVAALAPWLTRLGVLR